MIDPKQGRARTTIVEPPEEIIMPGMRLDHINIPTAHLVESIAFYGDLLGFRMGPPPTRTDLLDGAYAYDDRGIPVIHLVGASREDSGQLIERGVARPGMIDHFALRYEPGDPVLDRVVASGLDYSRSDVPVIGMHLIFLRDPNGIKVELGFPLKD
jgi:catechol 2,3-dioxygenase-like lactoylglutathione lyase family enzyme